MLPESILERQPTPNTGRDTTDISTGDASRPVLVNCLRLDEMPSSVVLFNFNSLFDSRFFDITCYSVGYLNLKSSFISSLFLSRQQNCSLS